MTTIPAQEVKRRGIGVVDGLLEREPVHIVKNNQLAYVVMREADYQAMMEDLALARIESSESDIKAGRVSQGSVDDLLKELDDVENE